MKTYTLEDVAEMLEGNVRCTDVISNQITGTITLDDGTTYSVDLDWDELGTNEDLYTWETFTNTEFQAVAADLAKQVNNYLDEEVYTATDIMKILTSSNVLLASERDNGIDFHYYYCICLHENEFEAEIVLPENFYVSDDDINNPAFRQLAENLLSQITEL